MGGPEAPSRPKLAPLVVEHEAEYLVGFPMYVAFALRAEKPNAGLTRLPVVTWHSSGDALGVRVKRGGALVKKDEPSAEGFREDWDKGLKVPVGGQTRILADIAQFFEDLPPGAYSVEVGYGTAKRQTWSKPFPIKLRAPEDAEAKDLVLFRPAHGEMDWGRWTVEEPAAPNAVFPPRDKRDPLRWNKTLRYLLYGPDTGTADIAVLDVLDGMWIPERDALRAEILAWREPSAAKRLADEVTAKHPGLWEDMNALAAGQGKVAFYRRRRRRPGP